MDFVEDAVDEVKSDAEDTVEKAKQACCCSCIGFLIFPIVLYALFCNEKSFVCNDNAIVAFDSAAKVEACEAKTVSTGDPVYLEGCTLSNLRAYSPTDWSLTTLDDPKFSGASASMIAEMYQCVEKRTEHHDKDKKGKTTNTRTTYSYQLQWSPTYVGALASPGDVNLKNSVCGVAPNPAVPAQLSGHMGKVPSTIVASDVKAGQYLLSTDYIKQIQPLSTVVYDTTKFTGTIDRQATAMGNILAGHLAVSGEYLTSCPSVTSVGCIRLKFQTTKATVASVLGGVSTDKIGTWTAPTTMVCEDYPVGKLWTSSLTKDAAVEELNSSNKSSQQMFRIILWLACWLSMYMAFYPLYAIIDIAGDWLDNIPCIGDWLEDFIENLAGAMLCVGSCCCGTFFALFTIALSWCFVRPMIGIPLMILALLLGGGILYWRSTMPPSKRKQKKKKESGEDQEMALRGSDSDEPEESDS